MIIEIEQQDDVCVMRIEGSLGTGSDLEYLKTKADQLKRLYPRKVLVDLSQVPYMGSTGIGFIVGIFTSVTMNAGQLMLVGLQPRVHEVFRLTQLNTIIPSAPDLPYGLAALRRKASQAAT